MGRRWRLRGVDEWYWKDMVFYHWRLRCMTNVDLKLAKLTLADAGQTHSYLNCARNNFVLTGDNPPVGLILCAQKDEAIAQYALEGLLNKGMAAEYRTALPDEELLTFEIDCDRKAIDVSNMLLGNKMSSKGVGRELQDSSGEFHDSERIQANC